jgi:RNA polymerase sigma-70 factor (ECF subfamily)
VSADKPHTPSKGRHASSFAEVAFRRHHAALQQFLMRRLRHSENAQDLAQEIYLRLLRVQDAEVVRYPLAFLYRLALNVVYEFRLRTLRDPVRFDSQAAEELAENPLEQSAAADTAESLCTEHELRRLLAPLAPTLRAVLILRKRDGMTNEEIAQELGLSVHTVKKYLARAVAQCRAAIESQRMD